MVAKDKVGLVQTALCCLSRGAGMEPWQTAGPTDLLVPRGAMRTAPALQSPSSGQGPAQQLRAQSWQDTEDGPALGWWEGGLWEPLTPGTPGRVLSLGPVVEAEQHSPSRSPSPPRGGHHAFHSACNHRPCVPAAAAATPSKSVTSSLCKRATLLVPWALPAK